MVLMTISAAMAQMPPDLYINGELSSTKLPSKTSEDNAFANLGKQEFPEITFYEMPPPKTITEKIESLLHGIVLDLPPKYDRYGYELRRSMNAAGGEAAYTSKKHVKAAIENTDRAMEVINKWEADVKGKIQSVEDDMQEQGADTSQKLTLKINKARVENFFAAARLWVNNNRSFLKLLNDPDFYYQYNDPDFNFGQKRDAEFFVELYTKRQKSLEDMHEYGPFRMMAY